MRTKVILSLLVFLGGCPDNEVTADLTVQRIGGTTFDANNNGTLFPIALSEGALEVEAINLVDLDADEETPLVAAASFDFFANAALTAQDAVVAPNTFEQIHVIPESGDGSLALRLAFTVTLSDTTVVNGQVNLSLEAEEEQILDAVIDLTAKEAVAVTLAFDPAKILGEIDFDILGAGGDFVIEADTGDVQIDTALATIEENLFTSFAFVSAQ